MSETFKVGDVVKLKSGSQRMVIKRITEETPAISAIPRQAGGEFVCLWRHNGKDCCGTYAAELLEKADDDESALPPINYD